MSVSVSVYHSSPQNLADCPDPPCQKPASNQRQVSPQQRSIRNQLAAYISSAVFSDALPPLTSGLQDVGCETESVREAPFYAGLPRRRARGQEYDSLVGTRPDIDEKSHDDSHSPSCID